MDDSLEEPAVDGPGPPRRLWRLSARSVSHSESALCAALCRVCGRSALNSPTRGFPARAKDVDLEAMAVEIEGHGVSAAGG